MKSILIFIVSLFSILVNSNSQITKDEAKKLAFEYVNKNNLGKCLIYLNKDVVKQNIVIATFDKTINSMTGPSFAFFIDKFPLANWAHPCSYLFINLKDSSIHMIEWKLPPNGLIEWELLTEIKEPAPVRLFDFAKIKSGRTKSVQSSDNCYAVIISGGYNASNNWQRYWNDCSAIYSALVNIYDFQDSHIKCLISDGTSSSQDRRISGGYDSSPLDLDGDQDNDIDYSATKANITAVFNSLRTIINSEDQLFIFVTDHGNQESGQDALIYLWGETIRDDQFAAEVDKIYAGQITIVMEQCYSGGFIDDLTAQNRVIATACDYNEVSYSMGYYSYDEFVFDWISAVAGEDPYENPVDADDNNDGFVSMQEAFNYAEANDGASETPQYNSGQYDLGYFLGLGFSLFISGPLDVCSSGSEFSVDNLADGTSITWSKTANITRISDQGSNPCEFQPYEEGDDGFIYATLTNDGNAYPLGIGTWVGLPEMPTTYPTGDPPIEAKLYDIVHVTIYDSPGADPYSACWYGWGSLDVLNPWGKYGQFYCYDLGDPTMFSVTTANECGTSPERFGYIMITEGGGKKGEASEDKLLWTISPNPAEEYLEINLLDNSVNSLKSPYNVEIIDSYSKVLKNLKITGNVNRIALKNLTPGLYIVRLTIDGKVHQKSLIIR